MIKRQILSILFISFASLGKSQTALCDKFRNGTFLMTYPGIGTVTIVRRGDLQTEEIRERQTKATYKVKWLNTCKYTLTPTSETLKLFTKIPSNAVITVEIVKVKSNSYSQVATTNYSTQRIEGEMIKIK